MDLQEFLESSAGNWFAQRTSYNLAQGNCENNKAEITVEKLSSEHPEVIELCQKNSLKPNLSCGGIKVSWDNSVDWGKPKDKGYSMLVFIPDEDKTETGKILRHNNQSISTMTLGRYILAEDESLTLIIEEGDCFIEERQLFVSPNLRLRSSLCKLADEYSITSFYSEIRKMPPKIDS
jgi:phycoerythrin-associated linker protein